MLRSKTSVFWAGVALLAIGIILASVGIVSTMRERNAKRDLETMVADLRAKGAMVENYYQVTGGNGSVSQRHLLRSSIIAGILVVTGASMMIVAKRQVRLDPQN